jgi:hypothetical protein
VNKAVSATIGALEQEDSSHKEQAANALNKSPMGREWNLYGLFFISSSLPKAILTINNFIDIFISQG